MAATAEIVTIDGPSGVGKSTISRKVSAALGFTYLDTGAMYRGVACYLEECGVDIGDETAVAKALANLDLQLLPAKDADSDVGVIICGKDVSAVIRTPQMSMAASAVSKLQPVREKLTAMQQQAGSKGRIVAEGRDTGTVVFPEAAYKFFLDATPEERARRRVRQLHEKGQIVDETEILALTIERDKNDRERSLAPLKKADDALLIDTTEIDITEVCGRVLAAVKAKRSV
ncbi:(d)CMP kinase [Desulfopila aestuarii]|uniref:Cytidylate kinase n=1 Tax=Desulfopila aestuarii DSM 18488 TaxID=1121416 RepID=A0A1M7XW54_9BACT|nr:(d)CMP kinase [Desulfopila aestuarii]SHO42952.1 cytidylate kinase [Desulfopila aestuarii DSM 18488]